MWSRAAGTGMQIGWFLLRYDEYFWPRRLILDTNSFYVGYFPSFLALLGYWPVFSPTRSTWIPRFQLFAFQASVGFRYSPWLRPVYDCSRIQDYRDEWTFGALRSYPIPTTSLQVAHRDFQNTGGIKARNWNCAENCIRGFELACWVDLLGDAVSRILRHHLHHSSRHFRLLVLGKSWDRQ